MRSSASPETELLPRESYGKSIQQRWKLLQKRVGKRCKSCPMETDSYDFYLESTSEEKKYISYVNMYNKCSI